MRVYYQVNDQLVTFGLVKSAATFLVYLRNVDIKNL